MLKQCHACFEEHLDLAPVRLVFIEEPLTATNMTRSGHRCTGGERRAAAKGLPGWPSQTTTPITRLRMSGTVAPVALEDGIEEAFARLESMLRKAAKRSASGLSSLLGDLVDLAQPAECASYSGPAVTNQLIEKCPKGL